MSFSKSVKYGRAFLIIAIILSALTFESRHLLLPVNVYAEPGSTGPGKAGIPLPTPGRSITLELSPNEIHSYQITLDNNQYFHAVIEQLSIEVGVTFYDPTGEVVVQLDCRHYGPTPLSIISKTSGVYRLEVRSLEREPTKGRYELRAEAVRLATAKDEYRITAEKKFAEGEQLLNEWKAESSRKAIDKFKDSLSSWKTIGDHHEEALALKRIGDIFQSLGEYQNALTFYNQAVSVSQAKKDRRGESETRNEICYIYVSLGEKQKASNSCHGALRLSQRVGNRRGEAQALNNLGEVYNWSGGQQKALDFYDRALSLWVSLGDRRGQAQTHLYLGYTYSDLGQMKEAFSSYEQAYALWQTVLDSRGQAMTLTAIGRLYSRMGESQEALSFFEKATQIIRSIGDPIEQGRIINGIAYVHDQLGEKRKAIDDYNQALVLFRGVGYANGEAMTLYDAGRSYYSLGENQQALEYYRQALSIFRAAGDRRLESLELREIGRVYDSLGEKRKALDYYNKTLSFWRSDKDSREEADTLDPIGRIYEEWGQKQKALDYYEKALPLSRKADYLVGQATTLNNIARVERDRGNLATAQARAEEALGVVESLREKVNSQDLRTSYFASVRQQYEFYINLLMRLHRERPAEGFDKAAFEASERARARSFLETLAVAQVGIREKADPVLLERENRLSKELNDGAARRSSLQPVDAQGEAAASALGKEIDELAWQLREVEAQISAGAMQNQLSVPNQPLGLRAIQEEVLDDNSILLEYSLGDESSYVWAVTRTDVASFELPGRAQIDEAALSFHKLLTANQPLPGETFAQRQERVNEANAHLPEAAASFSKLVLGPVMSKLGTKRLLIVADGALQYIPFQALVVPGTANGSDDTAQSHPGMETDALIPLIVDHEIVNEPSASALALLVSETRNRKPARNSVAVLADPVFEADDPRITSANKRADASLTAQDPKTGLHQALRDVSLSGDGHIPRLLASRAEADAIMSVTPWRSGFQAMGFDASRATVMNAGLGDYRIVHFATHGLLNNERPELSGIVLSLFDQKGQPQDGYLRLHDIYNLRLPVDLVVLSACDTGLGKDVKGEGLIGLTRGFMYAGASSVVASLWKVDDEATAELMRLFYGYMLRDGLSPAAALRKAQVTMSQQKRWQSPYYWAGFVIQGQYIPGERVNRFSSARLLLWLVAAGAVGAAAFYTLRRRRKITL